MSYEEIPFNKIMKDYKNWDEDIDLDNMNENYHKLERIMDRMFFRGYPKEPKYFSLLFSESDFADHLINALIKSGIKDLGKIYFNQYSERERNILISKGMLDLIPCKFGAVCVVFIREGNNYSINMVL